MEIKTKLDKRLEGLSSTYEITLNFVRENATEEEINRAHPPPSELVLVKTVSDIVEMAIHGSSASLEEMLEFLSRAKDKLIAFSASHPITSFGFDEYGDIYGEVWRAPSALDNLKGVRDIRAIWRRQFNVYTAEQAEWETYLALKKKFGE